MALCTFSLEQLLSLRWMRLVPCFSGLHLIIRPKWKYMLAKHSACTTKPHLMAAEWTARSNEVMPYTLNWCWSNVIFLHRTSLYNFLKLQLRDKMNNNKVRKLQIVEIEHLVKLKNRLSWWHQCYYVCSIRGAGSINWLNQVAKSGQSVLRLAVCTKVTGKMLFKAILVLCTNWCKDVWDGVHFLWSNSRIKLL